jgi:hypothetical protein
MLREKMKICSKLPYLFHQTVDRIKIYYNLRSSHPTPSSLLLVLIDRTHHPKKRVKNWLSRKLVKCFKGMSRKYGDEGDSVTQKRAPESSPDTVGAKKQTSTPSTSERSTKTKTTNLNLTQGKTVEVLRTSTSYFGEG